MSTDKNYSATNDYAQEPGQEEPEYMPGRIPNRRRRWNQCSRLKHGHRRNSIRDFLGRRKLLQTN